MDEILLLMGGLKRVRKVAFPFMFIVMISALLTPERCRASLILQGVDCIPAAGGFVDFPIDISYPAHISQGYVISDNWMYQREHLAMIHNNPLNYCLALTAVHPFRQSLQSLGLYSNLYQQAEVSGESPISLFEFDKTLTGLLFPLFVGSVLIGIAGIIRRYGETSVRVQDVPAQVETGRAFEERLSAET